MKRMILFLLICCLSFAACGIRPDFVISREKVSSSRDDVEENTGISVLINKNSWKYHLDADCSYARDISESNRLEIKVKNEEYLIMHGYTPCKKCSSEK